MARLGCLDGVIPGFLDVGRNACGGCDFLRLEGSSKTDLEYPRSDGLHGLRVDGVLAFDQDAVRGQTVHHQRYATGDCGRGCGKLPVDLANELDGPWSGDDGPWPFVWRAEKLERNGLEKLGTEWRGCVLLYTLINSCPSRISRICAYLGQNATLFKRQGPELTRAFGAQCATSNITGAVGGGDQVGLWVKNERLRGVPSVRARDRIRGQNKRLVFLNVNSIEIDDNRAACNLP